MAHPMQCKKGVENLIQIYGFHFGPDNLKVRCHGTNAEVVWVIP